MFFQIDIDIPALMTLILNLLVLEFNEVHDAKVPTYLEEGILTAGNMAIQKGPELTYAEASRWCGNRQSEMFEVKSDMDLPKLLKMVESDSVWTGYFKSVISQDLVNSDEMAAIQLTVNGKVEISHLDIANLESDSKIVLEMKGGVLSYQIATIGATKTTLCITELKFPDRPRDHEKLIDLKVHILSVINAKKDYIQYTDKWLKRELAIMTRVTAENKYALDHTVYREVRIRANLLDNFSVRIGEKYRNIRHDMDPILLSTFVHEWSETLNTIVSEVVECVAHPLALVDISLVPLLRPKDSVQWYLIEGKGLLVMIGDNFTSQNVTTSTLDRWFEQVTFYMNLVDISFVDLILITFSFMFMITLCIQCTRRRIIIQKISPQKLKQPRVNKVEFFDEKMPQLTTARQRYRKSHRAPAIPMQTRSQAARAISPGDFMPLAQADSELSLQVVTPQQKPKRWFRRDSA
jgi:hypothetical protein